MWADRLQSALAVLYPPHCLGCNDVVAENHKLCASCFASVPFITGVVCDLCGVSLPGQDITGTAHCDECMSMGRPWSQGRAAMTYGEMSRALILSLKHRDHQEIAKPTSLWLAAAARGICPSNALIVPVPLHLTRLLKRGYNQSALLAQQVARHLGAEYCPDALIRHTATPSLDGKSRDQRFACLSNVISAHPKRGLALAGRSVLLVDDVMTSGATLAACTTACNDAGAGKVCVSVLARVAKAD